MQGLVWSDHKRGHPVCDCLCVSFCVCVYLLESVSLSLGFFWPVRSDFCESFPADKSLAGVGLVLERSEASLYVRVKQLMPGGSADLSGCMRVGDRCTFWRAFSVNSCAACVWETGAHFSESSGTVPGVCQAEVRRVILKRTEFLMPGAAAGVDGFILARDRCSYFFLCLCV